MKLELPPFPDGGTAQERKAKAKTWRQLAKPKWDEELTRAGHAKLKYPMFLTNFVADNAKSEQNRVKTEDKLTKSDLFVLEAFTLCAMFVLFTSTAPVSEKKIDTRALAVAYSNVEQQHEQLKALESLMK